MNISSSKSPYMLQVERSSRPKATFGNRFRVAIDEEAVNQTTETAEEEEATKEYREEDPNESYALPPEEEPRDEYCDNIKDAEADYFLEKYGEKFNDSDLSKSLDELDETKDGVDPLQAMEEMTGIAVNTKLTNGLTDEDIAYFREKYGNGFTAENMETAGWGLSGVTHDENGNIVIQEGYHYYGNEQTKELFNELAEKNLISKKDALYASGGCIRCFNIPYNIWELTPEKLNEFYKRNGEFMTPNFEDGKNYSWDEYMQKRLGIIDKLRSSNDFLYHPSILDNWQRSLEKTQAVLDRIFGEVTL